jgi:release factor glutamine methyltransferase
MTPLQRASAKRKRKASAKAGGPTTVGRLLDDAERRFEERDVEFPDASALWLLAFVLGRLDDPDALLAERRKHISAEAASRFETLVERRKRHEPYQYIVGVVDFRGALMEIDPGLFVPREQTERMCDEIEAWGVERPVPRGGWCIAELGTGIGAMAVSLAKGSLAPRSVVAVDISEIALALVRRNVRRHGVEDVVRPVMGDWLTMIRPAPCLDVICAVPPYLNPGDEVWLSEESLHWEPMESFFGEPSGDDVLRMILDESAARLRPGGLVALQADSDQIPGLVDYVNDDPEHPLTIEWILQDDDGDEDAVLAVKPAPE